MIERRRAFATLEVITAVTLVSILVLSLVSLSGQSASKAYADGATIWTDKEDYAPGETVTISGAGFLPNSTVWLVIYNPQDETVGWDTTSDASGNFVTQFTLGGYEPYYTVFATDGQNQAETMFTDSINITLVSVASSNSSGTTQTSFTTSENIYAAVVTDDPGSGTVNELDVDIYVVSGVCPANNVAISDVSGGLESRTYTTGDTHVELVWSAPTSAGSYCIVVDADVSGGTLGTFDNGKDAAAAFTIAAPPVGNLTVIKRIINDNGGDALVSDFTLKVNGTNVVNGTENEFSPGFYNVTEESLVPGYATNFTGDCDVFGGITLESGDDKTCTITNDDIAPKLTINKTIINDNGGSATLADFEFFVNGTSLTNGTATDFDAGFYNVTETGPSAYNATFGGDCDEFGGITMAIGEEYTCTITNDDIAPILIVIKEVINDDGGSAVAANFTMTVNGTDVSPSSFPGEESPGTNVTLDAGNYNVTESGPILYLASFSADCDGFIGIGEVKTCTVTNDDISPFSVTSSSLCEIPDNQFRDIFTPDPSNLSYYKDTATNPGQFYVNVLVTGNEGDPVDIPITLPYPFVTQGANPIQVHDGVTLDSNECYVPSGSVPFDVDGLTETSSSGSYIVVLDDYPVSPVVGTTQLTYHVSGEIPASGLFYITIHLDFGLKGTGPWEKNSSGDALPISPNTYPTIPNGVTFEFGADDFDDQVLTKENVFKRNPGFAGIVSESGDEQPLQNVQLTFYDSKGKKIGTSTTDEDGYYSYYYKYTGKPTTVVIKLLNYGLQVSATMKANGFVLTNFEV